MREVRDCSPNLNRIIPELNASIEVDSARSGAPEGKIAMTRTIDGVPVKTRVPLPAWAFAGLLTLLSLSSSLVHFAAGEADASALQQVITKARHASVSGSS
jgi:hypothetical protein